MKKMKNTRTIQNLKLFIKKVSEFLQIKVALLESKLSITIWTIEQIIKS
jgi:uncharacterized protein YaaR (DUF327 family)